MLHIIQSLVVLFMQSHRYNQDDYKKNHFLLSLIFVYDVGEKHNFKYREGVINALVIFKIINSLYSPNMSHNNNMTSEPVICCAKEQLETYITSCLLYFKRGFESY